MVLPCAGETRWCQPQHSSIWLDCRCWNLPTSSSPRFETSVDGYRDLDVGNVTGRVVTQLKQATTYYYRVRAYNASGAGSSVDVASATTTASSGLIINATFDGSITSNPNAAAI